MDDSPGSQGLPARANMLIGDSASCFREKEPHPRDIPFAFVVPNRAVGAVEDAVKMGRRMGAEEWRQEHAAHAQRVRPAFGRRNRAGAGSPSGGANADPERFRLPASPIIG